MFGTEPSRSVSFGQGLLKRVAPRAFENCPGPLATRTTSAPTARDHGNLPSRFPQLQRLVEVFRQIGVQKRDDWRRGVFMLASRTPQCFTPWNRTVGVWAGSRAHYSTERTRQAAIVGGVTPHITVSYTHLRAHETR